MLLFTHTYIHTGSIYFLPVIRENVLMYKRSKKSFIILL